MPASPPPETARVPRPRPARQPKQARARQTRQRLLLAAIRCFEAHGYDGTTTTAIAAEAGTAVGTVYAYFDGKRELLLEIVSGSVAQLSQTVVDQLDPERWAAVDPRDATRALIELIFRTERLQLGMQRVIWERYFKDPDVREVIESIWARTREAIRALLDSVEQRGQLRPIDRESATHVIQNAVMWNASRAHAAGDPGQIDAFADATADMIARYVFEERAPERPITPETPGPEPS